MPGAVDPRAGLTHAVLGHAETMQRTRRALMSCAIGGSVVPLDSTTPGCVLCIGVGSATSITEPADVRSAFHVAGVTNL